MAEIKQPQPAKLISGVLTCFTDLIPVIKSRLEEEFGPVELTSKLFPFNQTDYYQTAMGSDIKRQFFAFQELIVPDQIGAIKVKTNQLEETLATEYKKLKVTRPVNLDPGYINSSKLVLATTKDYSHRIYLGNGIYAEVTLQYTQGRYQFWPWTFPDYQTKYYLDFFQEVRKSYCNQIKRAS